MIGRKRDNIARALRALGYTHEQFSLETDTTLYLEKGPIEVYIGSRGLCEWRNLLQEDKWHRLNSAAIAALVSAGEYIFLCGMLSSSERKRIERLVP